MNLSEEQKWWDSAFQPGLNASDIDFVSRDHLLMVEVQMRPQGMREFYAGVMRLAIELKRCPDERRGCLIIGASKLSLERLRTDWDDTVQVFGSKIARRLSVIVVKDNKAIQWGRNDPLVDRIAASLFKISQLGFLLVANSHKLRTASKADEIAKVLLSRWLQRDPPIGLGNLAKHVGCSYPTLRKAIAMPDLSEHLRRHSDSSIELASFPKRVWNRIVALATQNRNTVHFVDRSGQRPSTKQLLARLNRQRPAHVAIGGVVAARHWHPNFDLNGIPRIDLLVHARSRTLDLDFMKKLDPALQTVTEAAESPVVSIHTVGRAVPDFHAAKNSALPLANPVETALDLIEIGLFTQANQLFSHFRKDIRLL